MREILTDELDLRWRGQTVSRHVLGTAQLGMPYGIANARGQPDASTARDIVCAAWDLGVRFFDTAQGYGESERMLGAALETCGHNAQARVISKLDPDLTPQDYARIRHSIEVSCERLRLNELWGMLLHRAEWLAAWEHGLGHALRQARDERRIRYLGVSVYTVAQAFAALRHPDIDMIQVPCNAWDQRMLRHGVLEYAKEVNKLCFVRSLYLQGALTMSASSLNRRLPQAREASVHWHALARRWGTTVAELAIRFGRTLEMPLVIGAESPEQVQANDGFMLKASLAPEMLETLHSSLTPYLSEEILNPVRWI